MRKLRDSFLYASVIGLFFSFHLFFNMSLLCAQGGIPAVCSTGTDMDGDGIADLLDTDTDNDGIPDVEESATGSVVVDGQPTTLNGVTISNVTNLSEGDILLISNVITIEGTPIDLQIVIDSITSGATYDPTSGGFNLTPYNSSIDDLFSATLTFVESGTSTPYVLDAVEMIFKDIDSQVNRDFTEMVGLSGMPIVQLGDSLVMQNYENGGGIGSFTNYGVSKSVAGAATDWLDEINASGSDPDYWLTATYGEVSTFQFSYGVTGTLGNNSGSRGTSVSNIIYYQGRDTDGDGIDDYKDLDSDNDGIPDAIEACGDISLALEDCTLDSDGNSTYPDSDGDSCPDGIVSTACAMAPIDTDGDGTPDYLDLDSDGDGCADNIEAGTDALGTSEDTYVAGTVDMNGLLMSGISGACPLPSNTNWMDDCIFGCIEGDKDGDGIPDSKDLDTDNDGILDSEELISCPVSSITWLHNEDGGQSDYATFNNPSDASNYSSSSLASFGSGLDELTDNYAFTYFLRGADQITYPDAKANGDYAELSFTPSVDQLLTQLNFGFWTNNTSVPDFNAGNFKIAVEHSTVSDFSTFETILEDVQVGAMIGGGYVFIPNDLAINLITGTTSYFRFYFYDEQNTDPENRVRFDDIYFNSLALSDGCDDTDGDGISNHFDLDSDNDGIPDAIEACGDITLTLEDCSLDNNGDASYEIDPLTGCSTGVIASAVACSPFPVDTDGDGTPDYLDLDSDGDGCGDNVEAGTEALGTSDTSGYVAGVVDDCGLLMSGISGACPIPSDTAYLNANHNACYSCDLLVSDPIAVCDFIIANPMDTLAQQDCDNGGIDNLTECLNGGNPNDDCDDSPPTIVCPTTQIITGKGCEVTIDDYTNDITFLEGCSDTSSYTFIQSPVSATNLPDGLHTITITVTDANNNMATCSFTIEVDLIPPPVPTIFGN